MILQFFLYLGTLFWDWMTSVKVPTQLWDMLGFMYSGIRTLVGYTLPIPYLPYGALGNILTTGMTVFTAFLIIATVAYILRLVKLTGD